MSKIGFISLGCDKNSVDTEKMLYSLIEHGHEIVIDESEAEILIINTCAFIKDAKEESINTIIEMGEYKQNGKCKYIIVCGCLGERYKEEMLKEMPEVDAICGVHAYEKINEIIDKLESDEKGLIEIEKYPVDTIKKRIITTMGHYEYLKIAEGCNNFCTYCAIPLIRGKYKSRPYEDIIEESNNLAKSGVKELLIIAQETSCYGIDIYGRFRLHELVDEISKIEGIEWIRILYCYPENVTDELIDVIKNNPKVCKYIDIPIQHTVSDILRRMGRKVTKEKIFERIQKLRREIPEIAIRSTIIVGFPGETDEQFNELLNDLKVLKIDRLGAFDYSQEEGTPAANFDNQIDDEVKLKRKQAVMQVEERVIDELNKNNVDKEFDIIVDGYLSDDEVYCGRTYMDSPEIDGIVFFNSNESHIAGDIVRVHIESSSGYDLYGKEV